MMIEGQYAYTLQTGDHFYLPGDGTHRVVLNVNPGNCGVERQPTDDQGEAHGPDTVVYVIGPESRHVNIDHCPHCGADRGDDYCQECGQDRDR
jgi:hypothetical protein